MSAWRGTIYLPRFASYAGAVAYLDAMEEMYGPRVLAKLAPLYAMITPLAPRAGAREEETP